MDAELDAERHRPGSHSVGNELWVTERRHDWLEDGDAWTNDYTASVSNADTQCVSGGPDSLIVTGPLVKQFSVSSHERITHSHCGLDNIGLVVPVRRADCNSDSSADANTHCNGDNDDSGIGYVVCDGERRADVLGDYVAPTDADSVDAECFL